MKKGDANKKPYTVRGRLTGEVYAKASTLRGARAKRKKVAKAQWIDVSALAVIDPKGREM